ncbi:hypothetical protein LJC20_05760 [Eubacteriales bacterium OttesenSCG-928-M02]|nr:hypothetical protein [Eubacteriales bacterium OttesenSCG-928-M02]
MGEYFSYLQHFTFYQFEKNAFRNIYYRGRNALAFDPVTIEAIEAYRKNPPPLTDAERTLWADRCVLELTNRFMEVNQYVHFSSREMALLQEVYLQLLKEIENPNIPIRTLEASHYRRLRSFIEHTNPSIFQLNRNEGQYARRVMASEYPPDMQLQVLGVQLEGMREPVLDIGCGKRGALVQYLRNMGYVAYGIDRQYEGTESYIQRANYLEYDYGERKWGTVVSNLAFASHFLYHHRAEDGIDVTYAQAYHNILTGLQRGGKWYYAPSLPFMEGLLLPADYDIRRRTVTHGHEATILTKK